jgi:2-C-methyl-D-erythritol 4-phosphate cytidylyltransferase
MAAEASFNWEDPLLLDSQLTDEERMVRDAARAYCQDKLLPRVYGLAARNYTIIITQMVPTHDSAKSGGNLTLVGCTLQFLKN